MTGINDIHKNYYEVQWNNAFWGDQSPAVDDTGAVSDLNPLQKIEKLIESYITTDMSTQELVNKINELGITCLEKDGGITFVYEGKTYEIVLIDRYNNRGKSSPCKTPEEDTSNSTGPYPPEYADETDKKLFEELLKFNESAYSIHVIRREGNYNYYSGITLPYFQLAVMPFIQELNAEIYHEGRASGGGR